MDCSRLLTEKTDQILQKWVAAVRADRQMKSADNLSTTAIQNHLTDVLQAMATVLSYSQEDDIGSIVKASLQHGVLRAKQGFDTTEIAREYRLLRQVIFAELEAYLLTVSPAVIIRSMRLIDAVIDEASGQCFRSYFEQRLQELQQVQNQLQLNTKELTRLLDLNQDNISLLAHELKNPLTSIIGYSDLFLRLQRQPGQKDSLANLEHIERVLKNARQILRLINDTLEISRYEAGKMTIKPEVINVRELINNICDMLMPPVGKDLQIEIDDLQAPDEVVTDPLRLQQIVTNLVSNAIRYTESGTIKVTCNVYSHQKWAIAVADTGIGIAEEDQLRIFEPYFRISADNKTYVANSTGLGLAIVSRLVKLLQGEINLKSKVGYGSTFTVILPLHLKVSEEAIS
ncbi:MAG: HAMP domain-containing sensor histidine kinase [Nostocaceae cyanobacterium]|nr:HAMP domain-containing sensor histidine kinase [Nostocaceae cyanobacterium]